MLCKKIKQKKKTKQPKTPLEHESISNENGKNLIAKSNWWQWVVADDDDVDVEVDNAKANTSRETGLQNRNQTTSKTGI